VKGYQAAYGLTTDGVVGPNTWAALDELDAVVRCIELGAEDHLPKPFPAAILHARVESCLANKRMSDQLRKYTEWLFGKSLFSLAVAGPSSFALRRQERTVLFADIRGFTHWSERHTPEDAFAMLNRYFEDAERIWATSSVIKTEYTGDEIMALFGIDVPSRQGARRALAAAKAMGERLDALNRELAADLGSATLDPTKLTQILYNYVSNAIKFTPEGGRVTIRAVPAPTDEGEGDAFRVEVEDTGVGIASADLRYLFVAFRQLDASAAKRYPGTGLGLALTKRLAEAHGGKVGVHSVQGAGSTFWVELPRVTVTVAVPPAAQP
jgi:anti-sigma regulatory factor (Ser/Thr protein kinase)